MATRMFRLGQLLDRFYRIEDEEYASGEFGIGDNIRMFRCIIS